MTRRVNVIALSLGALLFVAPYLSWAGPGSGGSLHTVIVKPDGTVWTFGHNGYGQLGDGTDTQRRVPTEVITLSGISAIAAGANHTLALKNDGTVWAWGYNGYGQLGDGTTTSRSSPVSLTLTNIVAIAAGERHSIALTNDGYVYTWGYNAYGQLGNSSTTDSSSPVLISGLSSVSAIGAGLHHSLAVKSDGSAVAWGNNGNGQLGDDSTWNRSSPVTMSGISGATKIVGGYYHTIVLHSDGTLKAAGLNNFGQIGDNTTTQRNTAVSISGISGVTQIAAGQYHSLAVKTTGGMFTWGYNGASQLGDGTTTNRCVPTEITSVSSIAFVGAGEAHSMAISTTGVVYMWGSGGYGQLGDGTAVSRSTPTAISGENYAWKVSTPYFNYNSDTYYASINVSVTVLTPSVSIHYTTNGADPTESDLTVASGSSVTIDQTTTLRAKAWKTGMPASNVAFATYTLVAATPTFSPGTGTYTSAQTVSMSTSTSGATIRYTTDGSTPNGSSAQYTSPIVVGTTMIVKAIALKTGWSDSAVGSATYTMNFGTLSAPTMSPSPGTFTSSADVTLEAAVGSAIRYTTDGSTPTESSALYTTTLTIASTLTLKAKAFRVDYTPSSVTSGTYTINVAAPSFSPGAGTYTAGQAITVTSATSSATIRYSTSGADPTETSPVIQSGGTIIVGAFTLKAKAWKTGATPSSVTSAAYDVTGSLTQPKPLAGGELHSLAVEPDGVTWAWGQNSYSQLGDGTTTYRALPVLVTGGNGVVALAGGSYHSLALRSDGAVHAWGTNSYGQLGDGTTTTQGIPVAVSGLGSGVVAIAAGPNHSAAVKSDGTVVTWGRNTNGQLGDGTTTDRTTPVTVSGLTGIVAVAARGDFTVALKGDGSVWSWGANNYGQLGDGTSTQRTSPVQVSGLTNVVAIGAGSSHAVAVRNDGTAKSWGLNLFGQLGDGSWTDRYTPVSVSGVTAASAVAAGGNHMLILNTDGSVLATGLNGSGQLGDATTTNRNSVVSTIGLPPIVHIAAGTSHSLAMTADGIVYTWGYNYWGQLGDNTYTSRSTPSAISGPGLAWSVAAPTFNTQSGLFYDTFSVTVTSPDPTATIRYTTNGNTPTATDSTVASGGTVAISQSLTLKANAWRTGSPTSLVTAATYVLKAVTPALSPTTGSYGSAQSLSMSTTTSGATIRYTTDGSEPTSSSTAYSTAITVASNQTVKAVAFKSGWSNSDSGFASYWISSGTVATPTFSPAAGAFAAAQLVTLATTTTGASIRYTVDGTTPTSSSPLYVYPFVVGATTTVKALAFKIGYTASAVASGTYAIDATGAVATPALSPGGGLFKTNQTVTVTGESGATLRYTTNGNDPTETDTTIASGNSMSVDRSMVLKVKGWKTGLTPSAVRRADYVITGAIAAAESYSLALKANGSLWAWGRNDYGQLGDGTMIDRLSPVQVLTGVSAIAAHNRQSLAVKTDGSVWKWGNGSNTPTQVTATGFTNLTAVAAGANHALALESDGTVWAWGTNNNGQIGDGTTTTRPSPVQVPGISGITAIAAAGDISFAIGSDGAASGVIWAWGANNYGQLGDGSTLTRTSPVIVGALSSIIGIAAGGDWAIALKTDGSVWAWGANTNGVLGSSSTNPSSTPLRVLPLDRIVQIAAGTMHALAIGDDGRMWAWGNNQSFQLGQINYSSSTGLNWVPQIVQNAAAPVAIAGGVSHSLFVKPDGSVYAFGTGKGLGDGIGSYSELPVNASGLVVATNTFLSSDTDGDGLIGWREYLRGSDPLNVDTNGNGVSDGVEAANTTAPNNPDTDADGMSNWVEVQTGTDPFRSDSDGDSVIDGLDAFPLDPARSSPPAGTPGDTTPPTITLTEPTNATLVP